MLQERPGGLSVCFFYQLRYDEPAGPGKELMRSRIAMPIAVQFHSKKLISCLYLIIVAERQLAGSLLPFTDRFCDQTCLLATVVSHSLKLTGSQ